MCACDGYCSIVSDILYRKYTCNCTYDVCVRRTLQYCVRRNSVPAMRACALYNTIIASSGPSELRNIARRAAGKKYENTNRFACIINRSIVRMDLCPRTDDVLRFIRTRSHCRYTYVFDIIYLLLYVTRIKTIVARRADGRSVRVAARRAYMYNEQPFRT